MTAQLFYNDKNMTGEGAIWLPDLSLFLWVDIEGRTLHEYNTITKTFQHHVFNAMLSSIVPFAGDVVLLFLQDRILKFHLSTGEEELLLNLPFPSNQRPNDAKASPDGRLFMGVMQLSDYENNGALYRIDGDLTLHRVVDRQSIPNGIVWDPALDVMYYVDSLRRCIERYGYDPETGELDYQGVAVQVSEAFGVPDGMTIDSEGNLWVAHWGGFGVYVWNPTNGELIHKVEVPVPNVASCTFGKDGVLYITTARAGLNEAELEQYPLSGSLFTCQTTVRAGQNHYSFKRKEEQV